VFYNLRDVLVLVFGAQGGKYEYMYSGFVLECNSSTGTSTNYYISDYNVEKHAGGAGEEAET